MAWFGPEEDVPLLTRLYQVEVPTEGSLRGSELERLVRWWDNRFLSYPLDEQWTIPDSESADRELAAGKHAHDLAVRVMDLAADHGQFEPRDRQEIQQTILAERSLYKKRAVQKDGPLPLKDYDTESTTVTFGYRFVLTAMEELDAGLRRASEREGSLFRRCLQCNSVFIAGRRDQVRCSRRCNERRAAIRAYERQIVREVIRQENEEVKKRQGKTS